jgi:hypothetical protein
MIENWLDYSYYRFPKSNINELKRVRKYLIELARNETVNSVYYLKLIDDCKIDCSRGKTKTSNLTNILNDIFHYEFLNNRRFLTVLVISEINGLPKEYFFKNVIAYGGNKFNLSDDLFFNYEKNEVSKYWKNEDNYNEFKEFEDLTKQKIEYYKSKLP